MFLVFSVLVHGWHGGELSWPRQERGHHAAALQWQEAQRPCGGGRPRGGVGGLAGRPCGGEGRPRCMGHCWAALRSTPSSEVGAGWSLLVAHSKPMDGMRRRGQVEEGRRWRRDT